MPSLRSVLAGAALLVAPALVAACAEGSSIEDLASSPGGGDGGASGEGGRGSGGSGSSDGGASQVGSTTGATSTSGSTTTSTSTSTTSSASTSTSTSSSSTSATTSTGVTTSATTSTAASSSASTGGGDEICDPLNPALECGANQHCLPVPQGSVPECAPAGFGQHYDACLANTECTAITECIDVGDPFALPCCLQYCRNSGDCGGVDTCFFFDPPLFADGVQFGVCFDGSGVGCF